MVSSPNDLFKPDNIVFDGKRVQLVDWEAAFLNDRYADLAVVGNQVVANDEEEAIYLREYFGRAPDAYQRARYHLMQQLTHLFYTMAFLSRLRRASQSIGVERCRNSGTISGVCGRGRNLVDKDAKIIYARVHWERLARNVRQARYREALGVVSDRV